MMCRCVIFGGSPGRVPVREPQPDGGVLIRYVPCPDCGGSTIVSCCDGAVGGACDIANQGETQEEAE